ncbi:MAG: CHAT domain-containing protein [Candidatus Sumerlaeia bacterium]|nr:CHAT domain-containing protein [Candidatus Sumerlaeia bacterium]
MIRRHLHPTLVILLLAALPGPVPATETPVHTVAPFPADDYTPTVSPNGSWLVFSSERTGILNLHAARITDGRVTVPQPHLRHPARTYSPVFSPDGRHLAFISHRQDALGDVYIQPFPNGRPERLTPRGRAVEQPFFSRDGSTLYFRMGSLGETPAYHAYSLSTRTIRELDEAPDYFPVPPPYPVRALDINGSAALLYSEDTNRDGSYGDGDNPVIWVLDGEKWRQVSFPIPNGNSLTRHHGRQGFLVSGRWGSTFEIAHVDNPQLYRERNGEELIAEAERVLEATEDGLEGAIALYREGLRRPLDTEIRDRGMIRLLQLLFRAERYWQITDLGGRFLERDVEPIQQDRIRVEILGAEAEEAWLDSRRNREPFEPRQDLLTDLQNIRGRLAAGGHDRDAAEVMLKIARLRYLAGNHTAALQTSGTLLEGDADRLPPDLLSRVYILQSQAYHALGLGGETRNALLGVFSLGINDQGILDEAATTLIQITTASEEEDEARLFALRNLASQTGDYPHALARIRLAEAELLRKPGMGNDMVAWRSALEEAAAKPTEAPLPTVDASRLLIDDMLDGGELQPAIRRLHELEQALEPLGGAARYTGLARLRERIIFHYLETARRQALLGDWALARATWNQLLEYDPGNIEAWRGHIQSLETRPDLLKEAIAEYRSASRARGATGLDHYKYGLAVSYEDPLSRRALSSIRRAIGMDDSPYYLLTEGFLLEQRFLLSRERGRPRTQYLEEAMDSYERAMNMVNPERQQQLHADLLLNSANTSLGLDQYIRAHDLYTRRQDTGVSFVDPRTEMMYHWNAGIAAYRAMYSDQSARHFEQALERLDRLEEQDKLTKDQVSQARLELLGRRALALRDRDPGSREAERLFESLAELHPSNSLAAARSWRNVAFVREYRANTITDVDQRRSLLLEARRAAQRSLEMLDEPGLIPDVSVTRRSALFEFTTVVSDQGGRSEAFTTGEERALLRALMARVSQSLGERREAIDMFEAQIAARHEGPDLTPYEASMRSVTSHRLAGESLRSGDIQRAVQAAVDGLSFSRVESGNVEVLDVNGATHHLLRLGEILNTSPELKTTIPASALWMLDTPTDSPLAWSTLGEAARALLAYEPAGQIEGGPPPAAESPVYTARLLHLMTLVDVHRLEGLLMSVPDGGLAMVDHLARVRSLGDEIYKKSARIRRIASEFATPVELRRISLASHLVDHRVAVLTGEEEERRDEFIQKALNYTDASGQLHLRWWVRIRAGLAETNSERALGFLGEGLDDLVRVPSRLLIGSQAPPWQLLDRAEERHVRTLVEQGDLLDAWTATDQWRIARLSWLAELHDPAARTPRERSWQARFLAKREEWRSTQRRLQQFLPESTAESFSLRVQAARQRDELRTLLEEGRQEALRIVDWYAPEQGGFDTAGLLFDLPRVTEHPPSLVLHRDFPGGRLLVVYHEDETEEVIDDYTSLPAEGDLFVLGDPLPDEERSINLLSSFLITRSSLSMRPVDEMVTIKADGVLPGDHGLASHLAFETPVIARGYTPSTWYPSRGARSLRGIFNAVQDVERATVSVADDGNFSLWEMQGVRLALAAHLEAIGVTEAMLDDSRWIGLMLDASANPEEARFAWEEQLGRWVELREQPASSLKAVILERIAYLSEVIGETTDLAAIYGVLADTRGELGQWRSAMWAQERAAEILVEEDADPAEIAAAYGRLGDAASRSRNWPVAFPAYESAIDLAIQLGNEDMELSLLGRKADARESEGDFDSALVTARELAARYEMFSPANQVGEHLRAARILRVYQSRYQDALEELETGAMAAMMVADQEPLLLFEISIDRARVLQALALFDLAMDELDMLEFQVEELRAFDPDGDFSRQLAEIELERANTSWLRSDYREAFASLQEVLRLAGSIDEMDDIRIAHLNASGLTYWAVNDYTRAMSELEAALEVANRVGYADLIATTHNNIGLVYRSEGRYDEAMTQFQTALQTDRDQLNRWGEAYSLRNIGITLTLAGKPGEAIEPLREAVRLTREIGDRLNETKAITALADALLDVGDLDGAREAFQEAEMLAAITPVPEMHWRSLFGLGRERIAAGRANEALDYLLRAIDVVDFMRASIRIEEFQDGFLLDKQDLYDTTILALLNEGEIIRAFEASEKARGRNFIDLIGNRMNALGDVEDAQDRQRAEELRDRITSLQAQLASAAIEDRPPIEAELDRARIENEGFLMDLRERNPQLASFVRVDPATVPEIQAMLQERTGLLVYHILPEELVVFLLSNNDLSHHRIPVSGEAITRLVAQTRVGIQNIENVERPLTELSQYLVAPILGELASYDRLGIVPHRELHLLPFSALYAGPGENIIDRVALFYTPSASLLQFTMGRRGERRGTSRVLSLGNPELPGGAMDLPFAQKEAERLVFDFETVTLRTGSEATETWLRENISQFNIIHIASHGEFDPDEPLESALLLAPDGEGEDGRLTAADIFSMDIQADLITLSACQTGLGRISVGDDVIGLNRAFVYAGTRQILSTLWRVDDLSTAILFKYFYREVGTHDHAEALRRSQIRLRSRPEFQHPAHWSSVVLSGDWE